MTRLCTIIVLWWLASFLGGLVAEAWPEVGARFAASPSRGEALLWIALMAAALVHGHDNLEPRRKRSGWSNES